MPGIRSTFCVPAVLLALLLGLCVTASVAEVSPSRWPNAIADIRTEAEKDAPKAYESAKRLQASLPAAAGDNDRIRLLNLLARVALYRGLGEEGAGYAEQALSLSRQVRNRLGQAEAHLNLALRAVQQGDILAVRAAATAALSVLDDQDRPDLVGEALLRSAVLYRRLGEVETSVIMPIWAMEIMGRTNMPVALAYGHQGLAISLVQKGNPLGAREHFEHMQNLARDVGSDLLEADAILGLGNTFTLTGPASDGERLIREALAKYRKVGAEMFVNQARLTLADNLRHQGRRRDGLVVLTEAAEAFRREGNRSGLFWTLFSRAEDHLALGNLAAAKQDAEQSLALADALGLPQFKSRSMRLTAAVAAAHGGFSQAYRLSAEAADLADVAASDRLSGRIADLIQHHRILHEREELVSLKHRSTQQSLQQRWLTTLNGATLLLLIGAGFFLAHQRRVQNLLKGANERLRETQQEIQALNVELEARVATRTTELSAIHKQLEERNVELQIYQERLERLIVKRTEQLNLTSFALNRVHEGALLIDANARFPYVNNEACRMLGYMRDELECLTLLDIDPNWTAARFAESWRQTSDLAAGTFETTHRRKDGSTFPVEISTSHFTFEGVSYTLALVRDISRRKDAERKLHASEQAFRAVVENSPDSIVRFDRECRCIYMNPALLRLFGVRGAEVLGTIPNSYTPIADIDDFLAKVRHVVATGEEVGGEILFCNAAGEWRWGDFRAVPEFGPDGEVATVLCIGRDIHVLKESEKRYRTLADSFPDCVARFNGDSRFTYANPAVLELTGRPLPDILGKTPRDLLDEAQNAESCDLLMMLIAEAFRIGIPNGCEARIVSACGERLLEFRHVPERNAAGQVVSVLQIGRDITRLREIEFALRQSEYEFRSLAENLPNNVARFDRNARQVYVNPEYERQIGRPAEALLGKTLAEIFPDGRFAYVESALRQVIETGAAAELEFFLPGHGGGTRFIMTRMVAERNATGEVIGAIAIGYDFTARKQAESELHRREQEFRALSENSPDIIVRFDRQCRRIYVNTAFETTYHVPAAAVLGKVPRGSSDLPLQQAQALRDLVGRVFESACGGDIEVPWTRPNGDHFIHHIHAVPECDAEGNVVSVLAVGRDITALKDTERRLLESRTLLRELSARREEAREEERKRMAREIHDELGQHLTALRLGVSTARLQFGQDNPALRESLQDLIALTDKTIHVVREVAASLRPAALDSGINAALEWLASTFERRTGIRCPVYLPDEGLDLSDEQAMGIFRIVQESLTNVARHAAAQTVDIVLLRHENFCFVEVRDYGRGFDPAAPADKSFGLVGMRERTLMLGGELAIVSKPGEGTTVRARIPINNKQEAP